MRVLFDTNVLLDLLLNRVPFAATAEKLVGLVETGRISGLVGATSVTTLHYLIERHQQRKQADHAVHLLFGDL